VSTIKIEGLDKVLKGLEKLGTVGEREARRAIQTTAQKVRSDAIKSISREQSTGIVYQKSNPNRTHVASAPGDPPNTDTGELVRSIIVVNQGQSSKVGTELDKGAWLEFGTVDMAPRPWLMPALRSNERFLIDEVEKAIQRAVEAYDNV
jgi:HK97 gp10 family phage protein